VRLFPQEYMEEQYSIAEPPQSPTKNNNSNTRNPNRPLFTVQTREIQHAKSCPTFRVYASDFNNSFSFSSQSSILSADLKSKSPSLHSMLFASAPAEPYLIRMNSEQSRSVIAKRRLRSNASRTSCEAAFMRVRHSTPWWSSLRWRLRRCWRRDWPSPLVMYMARWVAIDVVWSAVFDVADFGEWELICSMTRPRIHG
jgi:hypothetical protein